MRPTQGQLSCSGGSLGRKLRRRQIQARPIAASRACWNTEGVCFPPMLLRALDRTLRRRLATMLR